MSGLFKFLTSRGGRNKETEGESPPSEIKGIFPMKCCAVTWNSLCLLCLLMALAPFNQMLNAMHALAFTVRVGLPRISMPRWFKLCVLLYLQCLSSKLVSAGVVWEVFYLSSGCAVSFVCLVCLCSRVRKSQ